MFRDKEKTLKTENRTHEVVTPLPGLNGAASPSTPPAKGPIGVSRLMPTPATPARDKIDPKDEAPAETKRLTVGRGISLKGKISSCDRLVIEGNVEAELENCRTVEVSESGTFKGAAEIAGAEISGHYEGSLTVHDNLLVRATGRVSGTVRYGRLHIEDGGEINGEFKSNVAATPKLRSGTGD